MNRRHTSNSISWSALTALLTSLAACAPPAAAKPAVSPASASPVPTASAGTSPVPVSAIEPPAPPAPEKPRRAIDAAVVERLTAAKPETSPDGVVKASFPRTDVKVDVDGFAAMPPFMGLTSWTAFTPGEKPDVEAMVMGDLVLFQDEVNPVMSSLLENGIGVTALHNHFFYETPHVFFMHVEGEGATDSLARAVRAALDVQKSVRQKLPQPKAISGVPAITAPSKIDPVPLDALFGAKGQVKDGMYKAVFGRKTTASCGCSIGKAMGVTTWAAFAGSDSHAVVDGDFAVSEAELQPVLRSLRSGGIDIVAIHHHMSGEQPRVLFVHYWGRGQASELAKTLKAARDLTAWDGKTSST